MNGEPPNEGSRRLLVAAAKGARLTSDTGPDRRSDRRARHSTGLVGTPDQVAEAMLDYYALGISTFLILGFDPLVDAIK